MVVKSVGLGDQTTGPSPGSITLLCDPTQVASRPQACLSLSERRGAVPPQSCEDIPLKLGLFLA